MKTSNAFFRCLSILFLCNTAGALQAQQQTRYPVKPIRPNEVLVKSLIIPGWGQLENRQQWKVPVIYAAIGGLVVYNRLQDRQYKDYRAAFYNLSYPEGDQRYGPTPDRLQGYSNANQLKFARDFYRNRRDISFVYVGLAYGFNALDAYIWAHLRMFDVSDNLTLAPVAVPGTNSIRPVLSASFRF